MKTIFRSEGFSGRRLFEMRISARMQAARVRGREIVQGGFAAAKPAGMVALVAAGALALGGAAAYAQECAGSEVMLDEKFDDNLCDWGCTPGRSDLKGGRYYISPKPGNNNYSSKLPDFFFEDAEFCVDVKFEAYDGEYMGAGLLVWIEDWDNNYNISLYSDGDVWIRREHDSEYDTIELVEDVRSLNTGAGAENRLMTRIEGSVITVFVNGEEVHKFRAQKPAGATEMGFYVSGREGENMASFDNLLITSVE